MKRPDDRWNEWLRLKPFDERDEASIAAHLHSDNRLLMTAIAAQSQLTMLCVLLVAAGLFRFAGMGAMIFVGMTICIAFVYWQQHLNAHAFNHIFRAALFEAGMTLLWAIQHALTRY